MTTVLLHDWSTTAIASDGDGVLRLQGRIDSAVHPQLPEAGRILTGPIVTVDGKLITTASGTVYRLEKPDEKYLAWCTANGYAYNEAAPIGWGKDSRKLKP